MLYILLISITVKNETVLLIYTREKKMKNGPELSTIQNIIKGFCWRT